jgi:intracellular multiplication protein IcmJ
MAKHLHLLLGVIRNAAYFRQNNRNRAASEAEFAQAKPRVKARDRDQCVFCGYESQSNEVHHLDGNHANNALENLAVADPLCHACNHVGQLASEEATGSDSLRHKSLVAAVPELDVGTFNLLQRALGVALDDPEHAEMANRIFKRLSARAAPVKDAFGTFLPGDFGAAMAELDDQGFECRGAVIGDLRLIFKADVLKQSGKVFKKDFAGLSVQTWETVAKSC